jgi:hypothetical protein
MLINLFNNCKISLLDEKWNPLILNLKLKIIPRINEFLYLNNQYYRVINIVHDFSKKQKIFLIVEKFTK